MKLPKLFRKLPKTDIEVILAKRDLLLSSPIFRQKQYMSTKLAKRMIEKLFEREL